MKHLRIIIFLVVILISSKSYAWGTRGHELIAYRGSGLVSQQILENCHITIDQLAEHCSDPDVKWRRDRRRHPDEALAHFFHVDKQPRDWRDRDKASDLSQGFLVYRIVKWADDAKELKKQGKWVELSERLFGLVHYIGDLTMPLHLTSKHDGKEVGLPDLHKQWETAMVRRYYDELDQMVMKELKQQQVPPLWKTMELKTLIFNIAEQSYSKSEKLFSLSADSLEVPRVGRHGRRRHQSPTPRFTKPKLFEATGGLAAQQLALASRLWAHTLSLVCQ